VVFDEPSGHFPDRLQIELHTNEQNLAESTGYSIPLYRDGKSIWRQGMDTAGAIDVAAVEIAREALPQGVTYRAFTPAHLLGRFDGVEVGSDLLVVGFPLGFMTPCTICRWRATRSSPPLSACVSRAKGIS
jgi:hypothetical protein